MLGGGQGELPPGSDFLQPSLSGDGRYLAYVVTSDAVLPGDTNHVPDIVVRDRVTGNVVRVSVASDGTPANGASGRPRISASGRYVAFWSEASTLVAGDTNGVRDVFLHDRDADGNGVFDELTPGARLTLRVSVASNGTQGNAASAAGRGRAGDRRGFGRTTGSEPGWLVGGVPLGGEHAGAGRHQRGGGHLPAERRRASRRRG